MKNRGGLSFMAEKIFPTGANRDNGALEIRPLRWEKTIQAVHAD
jgi:hypothetical protein